MPCAPRTCSNLRASQIWIEASLAAQLSEPCIVRAMRCRSAVRCAERVSNCLGCGKRGKHDSLDGKCWNHCLCHKTLQKILLCFSKGAAQSKALTPKMDPKLQPSGVIDIQEFPKQTPEPFPLTNQGSESFRRPWAYLSPKILGCADSKFSNEAGPSFQFGNVSQAISRDRATFLWIKASPLQQDSLCIFYPFLQQNCRPQGFRTVFW